MRSRELRSPPHHQEHSLHATAADTTPASTSSLPLARDHGHLSGTGRRSRPPPRRRESIPAGSTVFQPGVRGGGPQAGRPAAAAPPRRAEAAPSLEPLPARPIQAQSGPVAKRRHQRPASSPTRSRPPPRAIGAASAPPSRRCGAAAVEPPAEPRQARAAAPRRGGRKARRRRRRTGFARRRPPAAARGRAPVEATRCRRLGFSPRVARGSDRGRDEPFRACKTENLNSHNFPSLLLLSNI
jgi:hypothetical protein